MNGSAITRRPIQALVTLLTATVAAVALLPVVRWALLGATWSGTSATCRQRPDGACWTFIGHKLPFILFGLFPAEQRWRPLAATVLIVVLIAASAVPRLWSKWLLLSWCAGLGGAFLLMHGGAGLEVVPTRTWGGLPITLMLTACGLGVGLPLGILLALARRSEQVVTRSVATALIELIRGIPLIAVLYLAALVVPLAMPHGVEFDKLVLATGALSVFAAAYLAEAVRAGLQAIPREQEAAALSLGLTWGRSTRLIVLPQALRVAVPAIVSIAIGFFQDTSLVVIIGLYDLLNTARVAAQDPKWLGFHTEAFVFVGLLYFVGSAGLSRYGLWLERRLGTSHVSVNSAGGSGLRRLAGWSQSLTWGAAA